MNIWSGSDKRSTWDHQTPLRSALHFSSAFKHLIAVLHNCEIVRLGIQIIERQFHSLALICDRHQAQQIRSAYESNTDVCNTVNFDLFADSEFLIAR